LFYETKARPLSANVSMSISHKMQFSSFVSAKRCKAKQKQLLFPYTLLTKGLELRTFNRSTNETV